MFRMVPLLTYRYIRYLFTKCLSNSYPSQQVKHVSFVKVMWSCETLSELLAHHAQSAVPEFNLRNPTLKGSSNTWQHTFCMMLVSIEHVNCVTCAYDHHPCAESSSRNPKGLLQVTMWISTNLCASTWHVSSMHMQHTPPKHLHVLMFWKSIHCVWKMPQPSGHTILTPTFAYNTSWPHEISFPSSSRWPPQRRKLSRKYGICTSRSMQQGRPRNPDKHPWCFLRHTACNWHFSKCFHS